MDQESSWRDVLRCALITRPQPVTRAERALSRLARVPMRLASQAPALRVGRSFRPIAADFHVFAQPVKRSSATCQQYGVRAWHFGSVGTRGGALLRATASPDPLEPAVSTTTENLVIPEHADQALQAHSNGASKPSEVVEASSTGSAPVEKEKGIPHRWRVVFMMMMAFVLCNMDKVRRGRPASPGCLLAHARVTCMARALPCLHTGLS